jgi:hypothetical protein
VPSKEEFQDKTEAVHRLEDMLKMLELFVLIPTTKKQKRWKKQNVI